MRIGRAGKWGFFESAIMKFFFQKNFFLLHLNKNKQPVHMRYHLFLYYGWFLQNLGKNFIRTKMHTTVWGPNTWTNDTRSQNSNAAYKYILGFLSNFFRRSWLVFILKKPKFECCHKNIDKNTKKHIPSQFFLSKETIDLLYKSSSFFGHLFGDFLKR